MRDIDGSALVDAKHWSEKRFRDQVEHYRKLGFTTAKSSTLRPSRARWSTGSDRSRRCERCAFDTARNEQERSK